MCIVHNNKYPKTVRIIMKKEGTKRQELSIIPSLIHHQLWLQSRFFFLFFFAATTTSTTTSTTTRTSFNSSCITNKQVFLHFLESLGDDVLLLFSFCVNCIVCWLTDCVTTLTPTVTVSDSFKEFYTRNLWSSHWIQLNSIEAKLRGNNDETIEWKIMRNPFKKRVDGITSLQETLAHLFTHKTMRICFTSEAWYIW